MQEPSRVGVFVFSLFLWAAGVPAVSAQSANFEAEKGRLHQQAARDRAALGIELLDPRLDVLYPYSQIEPVTVRKILPGASATVALTGIFPPGVAVLSDRDGAVLSGAELSSTEYSARITVGATEGPGYVKLWAITPVHHVWTTMPVLFIDAVYRFDLKSANGYTVLVTPTAPSFTLEGDFARLPYKAEFYRPGESTPFQTRKGWMSYNSDKDTTIALNIDFPEPEGAAAQELDNLMKQMDDPGLTDAQRSDLTVRMVEAQQRMLAEMMNADPAAAQKKIDEFGCRMVQVDPGPGGTVAGGIVCGKDFAGGGGLQVTGTMTQVR
jgi:hypothetical protein